jgi:PAS domain S-box-containing protein
MLILVFGNLYIQISKNDKLLSQNLIFSKLIESSNESISISDENHVLIYCNNATEKLYKTKKEDMIGKPIEMGIGKAEDKEGIKDKIKELDQGNGWVGEVERRDSNNNPIYLHLSINNIKNEQGKTIAHAAISSDLTKLKNAQKENEKLADNLKILNNELAQRVQQQTVLIKDVFERVRDIFIGTDENFRINYANTNVKSLFGLNESEIITKRLPDLLANIINAETMLAVLKSLKQHSNYTFEFLHPESQHYFEANIYPSSKGVSLYFRDIDKKQKSS